MTNRLIDPEGPLTNFMHSYFRGLDMMWKHCDPALMNLNSECVRLVNRRATAWLDIPASLGRCKTPKISSTSS
jgi:hypothetical protein